MILRKKLIGACKGESFFLARQAASDHGVDWSTFDEILFTIEPSDGAIQIFMGERVSGQAYSETVDDVGRVRTRVLAPEVERLLREGATLVLNRVESKSRVIHSLVRDIMELTCRRAVANAYIAFGGAGSFGKHWDTHDVFVVQLKGSKRWRVYEPTFMNPIAGQTSAGHKDECPLVPVLDTLLEDGDILYIPRGWWHEAIPIDGCPTAHVAIGTHPHHLIDYANWYSATLSSGHPALREVMGCEDTLSRVSNAADAIAAGLKDPRNIESFSKFRLARERIRTSSNLGAIASKCESIGDECRLLLNGTVQKNHQGEAVINGVKVVADHRSMEFIASLEDNPDLRVSEILEAQLPCERGRIKRLIHALVSEGVCSIRDQK